MRAILIDDEVANLENLQILLARHCPDVRVVATANGVEDAFFKINSYQPDVLFLDIQMGKLSGFDLLEQVPVKNFEVIFVTAYDQYGIRAVKFAALDYLLKPINADELISAVSKASSRIKDRAQNEQLNFLLQQIRKADPILPKIALPQQNEIRYVVVDEITRCEADNTYTTVVLASSERILVSKPLKEYAELLKLQGFLRVHQSHLINPSQVKSWLKEDGGVLLLKNGDKVPVSKANRELVKLALGK